MTWLLLPQAGSKVEASSIQTEQCLAPCMFTVPLCAPPTRHTTFPFTMLLMAVGCCSSSSRACETVSAALLKPCRWHSRVGEGHAVPDMTLTAGMSSTRSRRQKTCWQRGGQGCQRGRGVRCPALPSFIVPEGIYMSSSSLISAPRLWRTGPATPGMATMMASSSTGSSRASCCRLGTPWVCCPLPSQPLHLMSLLGNILLLTKCFCHGQLGCCLMVMAGRLSCPQLSSFSHSSARSRL